MSLRELGRHKGWTAYWDERDHRLVAKQGGWLGRREALEERPRNPELAWMYFRSWANRRL